MTIFYEGQQIEWSGGGFTAEGHIVALSSTAAHVKWASGPDAGRTTLTDLYDIEHPVPKEDDPLHLTAVRRAFDKEEEAGVLNFLASNQYLGSWTEIAQDVLAYAEDRIRTDASMELVDEQLTIPEKQKIVTAAALTLLRDAFGEQE